VEKIAPKNILFITLVSINKIEDRNLYADLIRCFVKKGHHVSIISPMERRMGKKTYEVNGEEYKIIKVRTPNIQKTNPFEKIIGIFAIDYLIKSAIKQRLVNDKYDIAIYSTPPITLVNTIKFLKDKYGLYTYLLLKDIFPQNAVDIGLMNKNGFFHKYFRKKEQVLYDFSDNIGCMSEANRKYVLNNNSEIQPNKVEVCPNCIEVNYSSQTYIDKNDFNTKHGIPLNARVFIYGGNLGKPQGIQFLIEILKSQILNQDVFFIIIGSGTEYAKLNTWVKAEKPQNVILKEYLPKSEYDKYVEIADVGLIFLDHRFTIPNYPSRLLSYMEYKKPVLIFSDKNTDIGSNAEARGYGVWSYSNDLENAIEKVNEIVIMPRHKIEEMGLIGHNYLKENYSVANTYEVIVRHLV